MVQDEGVCIGKRRHTKNVYRVGIAMQQVKLLLETPVPCIKCHLEHWLLSSDLPPCWCILGNLQMIAQNCEPLKPS